MYGCVVNVYERVSMYNVVLITIYLCLSLFKACVNMSCYVYRRVCVCVCVCVCGCAVRVFACRCLHLCMTLCKGLVAV